MTETRRQVWVSQPLFDDIIGRLEAYFDVRTHTQVQMYTPAQIAAHLRDAAGAVVTLNERIGAAEIAQAPALAAIANVGVGYNNLDIPALHAAGIVATNTPDVLTDTTADFGFALLLATARRITEAEQWLRAGHWQQWSFRTLLGSDLHGSTLGIIGMGRIGQGIARRAAGFDMTVCYHNRHRLPAEQERACRAEYVDLPTLLTRSDHLLLALPYSAQVHHLIDAAALAQMKPTATLINIARGGLVDELALAQALAQGRLAAAGLDVYEDEPQVRPELLALPNVVLTPHIASASLTTRRAMVTLAVDNLIAALGEGPHAHRPANPILADNTAGEGKTTAIKR